MFFYRTEGFNAETKETKDESMREKHWKTSFIAAQSMTFNMKLNKKTQNGYFFVSDACNGRVSIGAFCRRPEDYSENIESFLKMTELSLQNAVTEEVTFSVICRMLRIANRKEYIDDDDEILESFGLDGLECLSHMYGENIIERAEKEEIYEKAKRFLANEGLISELDRIFAGKKRGKVTGHPVHYIIRTDDRETRKELYRLLLSALYENERISSRRYCYLDFKPGDSFPWSVFDTIYKNSAGGAVVIRLLADDDTEDDHASCGRETMEKICETVKKYKNSVLTVFCFQREHAQTKDILFEYIGNVSFIELKEEHAYGECAKGFLKTLARESGIRTDKKLFAKINEDTGYLATELRTIFEDWHANKLRTDVFPQYKKTLPAIRETLKTAPKGSSYDELMNMIGVEEAKSVILKALDYHKAQKLFADKGMKAEKQAMHMVFTGNPGTAKTTVARLFAGIMKDNGLLSDGRLIEVGRGDLVGKYVGWTAPIIQKKFKEAQGCVLFIDEAYSLVDDRNGSFGDEAINTIVQEMENHRDDVVVIFAGYPDKMEEFLKKNPGLRSRIAFHVPFPDYKTSELCGIAESIAEKKGVKLSRDALIKLERVFENAKMKSDFGNGRYVRNVLEKAKMAQAARLLDMDYDSVDKEDITTIRAEDIEDPAPAPMPEKARKSIGFRVA